MVKVHDKKMMVPYLTRIWHTLAHMWYIFEKGYFEVFQKGV